MNFGQIEQEGLADDLWSLYQQSRTVDYFHLMLRSQSKKLKPEDGVADGDRTHSKLSDAQSLAKNSSSETASL